VIGRHQEKKGCVVLPFFPFFGSVLGLVNAPCYSLISNSRRIREMPVLQAFLAISAATSLFFSKITLILAK
jgi:hypothetical protein